MERGDFDSLIRDQLGSTNTAHAKEINEAKPFVWASVRNNLDRKTTLRWYHLAAAILLLMISFTFLLNQVQKSHNQELSRLSDKLDRLEQDFQSQEDKLMVKEQQVSEMAGELRMVEIELSAIKNEPQQVGRELVVYKADTIYIKQIEYVTVSGNNPETAPTSPQVIQASIEEESTEDLDAKFDAVIYPNLARGRSQQKSESVKVKFGNARTIRN